MRILHTSDWHLGKKLDTKSRIDEQRLVLKEITDIVKNDSVDIVCLSGDIYDTYLPSAEAEKLFYDAISDITKAGAQIIVISGNHDDPLRLTASNSIAFFGGVYFSGIGLNSDYSFNGNFKAKLKEYGDDYFIFEKDGESLYFACLSYPTELRMKEKINENESYEDKVKRYIQTAMEKVDNLPVVLLAHIFMLGGVTSDGERPIDLGGARILPLSVIPDNVVYTALGHLHKRQVVSKERNIAYSGSIMQYSFDEAGTEKSVFVFDVIGGKVNNLQTRVLHSYKRLNTVTAQSIQEAEDKIAPLDGYVLVKLSLDKPEGDNVKDFLQKHPNASVELSFKGVESAIYGRKKLNDKELFVQYYMSKFGKEPSEEILKLYLSVIGEEEI